jgi:hypothetical protein
MTDRDLEQIRAVLHDVLAPTQAQVGRLEALTQALDSRLAGLEAKIDTWPDLHFLQATAQRQIAEARDAGEFRRYVEIKLDEIYGSMATSSEIKKLRQEVAKSLERENELDLPISTIEMRLGIKNPLAPES